MDILDEGFRAQAKTMREFGYPSVTADLIRQHHAAWLRGETAKDVIFRFSESAFEDHPGIFGKRPDAP